MRKISPDSIGDGILDPQLGFRFQGRAAWTLKFSVRPNIACCFGNAVAIWPATASVYARLARRTRTTVRITVDITTCREITKCENSAPKTRETSSRTRNMSWCLPALAAEQNAQAPAIRSNLRSIATMPSWAPKKDLRREVAQKFTIRTKHIPSSLSRLCLSPYINICTGHPTTPCWQPGLGIERVEEKLTRMFPNITGITKSYI